MITTQIKYTETIPPYFILDYEITDGILGNSDSTSLIELSLYDFTKSDYLNYPPKTTNSECKILDLKNIAVSCDSDDFNIRILNKNNISLLDTKNEIYKYININKVMIDADFSNYFISNEDSPQTNKLYLFIENNSATATGTIKLQLIYISMKSD